MCVRVCVLMNLSLFNVNGHFRGASFCIFGTKDGRAKDLPVIEGPLTWGCPHTERLVLGIAAPLVAVTTMCNRLEKHQRLLGQASQRALGALGKPLSPLKPQLSTLQQGFPSVLLTF